MSDGSRADQRKGGVDAACVVPSVKDILDGVAAEAGLSTFDDDTFRSGLKLQSVLRTSDSFFYSYAFVPAAAAVMIRT